MELLIPARNPESGIQAINHGADALYIGSPRFGARSAVGNPVSDIEMLTKYAHQYNSRVYITLNTILFDHELEDARKLIWELYEAGADALIIQDMGILEMDLPPIALHASTQTNNYDPHRISFLDQVGFKRIVLARELPLETISAISNTVKAELEVFVHGALCVSLSGQCYLSHALGGRSANRGECAQPCRKTYTLKDAQGEIILQDKHLLSLKDMNRAASIEELANAGVTSFKVEGRLKDIDYIKNITTFYRKQIDRFLEKGTDYCKASSGTVTSTFIPDPERTFSRGYTDYFLHQRSDVLSMDTPKSKGKLLGEVIKTEKDFFILNTTEEVHNNDGLIFFTPSGEIRGLKVNRVIGNKIYPATMTAIPKGAQVWRNYDHQFQKQLEQDPGQRTITAHLDCNATTEKLELILTDEDQLVTRCEFSQEWQVPKNSDKMLATLKQQLCKSGNSIFTIHQVEINGTPGFIPIGQINEMRRQLLEKATERRITVFKPSAFLFEKTAVPFPNKNIDFSFNVSNRLAHLFYKRHGVEHIENAFEIQKPLGKTVVMTTKHCLKYSLGFCNKYNNINIDKKPQEPFYLCDGDRRLLLEFNCNLCFMQIILDQNNR
ncbi:MAG: U32 family peptidase [Bacteroidota bacterium]|nr:U32 family peptidase [Bacteroidota bacterium]